MARSKDRRQSLETPGLPHSAVAQAAASAARVLSASPDSTAKAASPAPAPHGIGGTRPRAPRAHEVAERALLAMARDLTALAACGASVREALTHIARTSSELTLRRARLEAWLDEDETRALSLAWAREQLRLALEELITALATKGGIRTDVPAATLAWMLLAACEAIAVEPPGDADDRIEALMLVIGETTTTARGTNARDAATPKRPPPPQR